MSTGGLTGIDSKASPHKKRKQRLHINMLVPLKKP